MVAQLIPVLFKSSVRTYIFTLMLRFCLKYQCIIITKELYHYIQCHQKLNCEDNILTLVSHSIP